MERNEIDDRFMSINEATEYLGLTRQTIYAKIKKGQIKAYTPVVTTLKRRSYRFKKADLDSYMGLEC